MDKSTTFFVGFVVGVVIMACSYFIIGEWDNGYKAGQTDALRGKWKYEMRILPDTLFVEIK